MNAPQSGLIPNDPAVTVLKSVCRSCHGGCGVLLHVRDGVLLKVEGDRASPLNHGRLCPIGTVTTDLVYHPDRLKYPLRRKGKRQSGDWQRISWDEALDEISQRLLAIRERIRAGGHRARHRHRPPSYPLGVALRPRARHAQLVRAGLRAMFPPAGEYLDPDLRRFPGQRLHRRGAAGLHPLLGSQPGAVGTGRRDALQRDGSARAQSAHHRGRSAPHGACRKGGPLAADAGPAPTTRWRWRCSM